MNKDSVITFRLTKEEKKQLDMIARLGDRKISYVLQKMVQSFLEDHKES